MNLIKATVKDWEKVGAIEGLSSTKCFKALTLEPELVEYLSESQVFFIEVDGENVGTVGFKKASDEVAQIRGLNIHPAHRGHGYGKEVMTLILAEIAKQGYKTVKTLVHPESTPALITYLKSGFLVTGFSENYWGDGEARVEMGKGIVFTS